MSNNVVTLNNPGLKTPDVLTATGVGYIYTAHSAGNLHVGLSEAIITTLVATNTAQAVVALQLVRSATAYTLGTFSPVTADAVGKAYKFTPSTSVTLPGDSVATNLTNNPFVPFIAGDTIRTNVTTAGTDSGSAAGAYEVNIIIESAV